MSRYIVIGAGAVGAALAAQLHEAGTDYVLVGRGEQLETLRQGLRYRRPSGTITVPVRVAGPDDDLALTGDDVLVLAVKTQHADAALADWAWRPVDLGDRAGFAADLPLVTLQNGLDAERSALRRFARVYAGSLLTPSRFTDIGEVVAGSEPTIGVITLGRFPTGLDDTAAAIAADLRAAGYVVQLTDRVQRWKADKLVHSAKNAVELLQGSADDKAVLQTRVDAESQAVLAAAGVDIADRAGERTEDVSGFGPRPESGIQPGQQSTWQSFARGASSHEVDFLTGEVVLLGRLHGVPTPYAAALQAVAGNSFARGEAPGTRDAAEVLAVAEGAGAQRAKAVA